MKPLYCILAVAMVAVLPLTPALAADAVPSTSAEAIVAELSDEQVRRMLIEELRTSADTAGSSASAEDKGALVGVIEGVKNGVAAFHDRLAYLRSGGATDYEDVPGLFVYLGKGAKATHPAQTILSVVAVFAAAFGVELLFFWYTAAFRHRLLSDPITGWRTQVGKLLTRAGIDGVAVLIFIAATLLIFFLFTERNTAQRVLVATYLAAVVVVRIVYILLRLILAPKAATLRFLPLSDATALYLHRWILAITMVSSFGMLTCGIMRLAGSNEAEHIKALFMLGVLLSAMLVAMILQKRRAVSAHLGRDADDGCLQARFAAHWHHFAIGGVLLLLFASTFEMIMGHYGGYWAFKTLVMVPLYFLFDWILRQILNTLFGFVAPTARDADATPSPSETSPGEDDSALSESEADAETAAETADKPPAFQPIEFDRMRDIIQSGLRVALAALFIVWILRIWGIEFTIGGAVARATFNILIVVLLCFVGWEFLNAAIQRRLKDEMPDDEEEQEEGGAGGSRIGTLLLLLRKFMLVVILVLATMIILSAIGVNIGPLIAGAGVLGLAIGFGAQTLVKDIISGVFFLVDDAFRVGDYIEVGGSKGMVEQISLRSLKLRHPRGMVNTIPFGDIATVTNFSRDYIVTKLDFRVRYDTDVEKVRKIIKKKVYKVILKNPDLGPKLLDKIKSQGVREMDDSAMIMRIKYKTIPGEQFAIRKEVYRLLQEAFKEAGIEFAHKNVTVYMPPEAMSAERALAGAAAAAEPPPAGK
ncbi:MAG: mechanosensitive ion channel [Desulfosarcinaceae bacterium]|nr:mechanosensitive ion channel [Desulfosarcinaceae bacterium]